MQNKREILLDKLKTIIENANGDSEVLKNLNISEGELKQMSGALINTLLCKLDAERDHLPENKYAINFPYLDVLRISGLDDLSKSRIINLSLLQKSKGYIAGLLLDHYADILTPAQTEVAKEYHAEFLGENKTA